MRPAGRFLIWTRRGSVSEATNRRMASGLFHLTQHVGGGASVRTIKKKALALTWACERFQSYLIGMDFLIQTDHKPLISLLGSRALDDLPPRILRFRLRLLCFTYTIEHVPGKNLITADALSKPQSKRRQQLKRRSWKRMMVLTSTRWWSTDLRQNGGWRRSGLHKMQTVSAKD